MTLLCPPAGVPALSTPLPVAPADLARLLSLGGNSGSPVFGLTDHRVLGLHFGGRCRLGNYAVPLWRVVDDPRLRRAEVNFV
ncbi:hypothetical protein AB0D12_18545 [Streptomyces sp. NPDC048479]|uniref:hypothetical protein n=1 Tax=Streptomyces sp. NPDC048479 TaxID=3154725 RepID=UPI0034206619